MPAMCYVGGRASFLTYFPIGWFNMPEICKPKGIVEIIAHRYAQTDTHTHTQGIGNISKGNIIILF